MKYIILIILSLLFWTRVAFCSEVQPFVVVNPYIAGFGNNMFRYAAILSYALDKNLPACLNAKKSAIAKFPNLIDICSPEQKEVKCSTYGEKAFLSQNVQKGNCLQFSGYCQNPNYFINHEADIRHAFEFPPLDEKNQKLAQEMENQNSISLHFRRGNYISHGYPIMGLEYYKNAIQYITEKDLDPPHLYIFSNDIKWVEGNFHSDIPYTLVKGNDDFTDMNLMSHCRHNIIANSTFSWWGAWLNKNPNKIVIAPDRWDDWHPNWGKTILPKEWITMDAHAFNFVTKK